MIWRCWTRTKVCSPMTADYSRPHRAERAISVSGGTIVERNTACVYGFRQALAPKRPGPVPSLHVERLGPGGLARGIGGDVVNAGLVLAQQLLAAALQGFAALIDFDRFLQRHLAFLEPL